MSNLTYVRKKGLRILALILLCLCLLTLGICIFVAVFANRNIDYRQDEILFSKAENENVIRLYAGDEENPQLYEDICYSENTKTWVGIEEIAPCVKNAFLAAEDRDFFEHNGINFKRTVYAAVNYLTKRQSVFGASTITQQVIKNISGDDEVTLKRKFAEILRAMHMEKSHTKEEILGVYLNIVPLSENVIGVGSGALTYFDKEVSKLNPAQAATLAAITNAPTKYNPYWHPEACLEKRNHVLFAMKDAGYLDDNEYEEYCSYPLGVVDRKSEKGKIYSWFSETVMQDVCETLCESYGYSENTARQLLARGGLSVYTTVNPEIQTIMEETFENTGNLSAEVKNGLKYAMCVVDSENGNLLGIIGGAGEKTGNRLTNFAVTAHTPGSCLKPIALYAPLIDEGKINSATVLDDVPTEFSKTAGGYDAFPENSPKIYAGLTTVSDALRLSKNTVAVRLYRMRGAEAIYSDLVHTFGFDTVIRQKKNKDASVLTDLAVSPLALGQLTYGISLRKLTEAYTVFPADGILHKGRSFTKVVDVDGNTVLENSHSEKRVYRESTARIMNQLLSGVVNDGTAKSIKLKNTIATAGKTGTSGNNKDKLFIGYTPIFTAGIWCGYENGESPVSQVSPTHLELWDMVMTKIQETVFNQPNGRRTFSTEGLIRASYCKDSGELFSETCAKDPRNNRLSVGYFTAENKPTILCTCHVAVAYDSLTGALACENCRNEDIRETALIRVENRSFPKEIIISDAQYVYREFEEGTPLGDSYDIPYFYYQLNDGEYVGRSPGTKQYNSFCYLHDDNEKSA